MKNKLFFVGLFVAALMFASCDPVDVNDSNSYCWEISYKTEDGATFTEYEWATGKYLIEEILPGIIEDGVVPVYKKVESAKDESACDALNEPLPNEDEELVCLKVIWPDHTHYVWVTMEGWLEDLRENLEPGEAEPSWERSSETDYDACEAHNREACIKVTYANGNIEYQWKRIEAWREEVKEMEAAGIPAPLWEETDEEDPDACEGLNQPTIN